MRSLSRITGIDGLTRDGAHYLKRIIDRYWADKGLGVPDVRVEKIGNGSSYRYDVRSNMVNGMPLNSHTLKLLEEERKKRWFIS